MELKDLINQLIQISLKYGNRMEVKTAIGSRTVEEVTLTKNDDGMLIVNLD